MLRLPGLFALLFSLAVAAHAQRVISFPNQCTTDPCDGVDNRNHFNFVILPDINHTADTKVLQFDAGTYDFALPENSGQMEWFLNAHNLTVRGHADGTTLRWWVENGGEPHSLFVVDSASRNIQFENLAFTTAGYRKLDPVTGQQVYDVTGRPLGVRHVDGTHIKIFGKHIRVFDCHFSWSPNHAIGIGSSSDPVDLDYIHVSGNTFENSIGDSIHVWSGSEVWIVGNTILHSGDDAIAVYNDLYGQNGELRIPRQIHIEWNNIQNSHWRGILIGTSYDVGVWNNTIHGTARYGIEVLPVDTPYTPPTYWEKFPNIVLIRQNQIEYTGYVNAHQTVGNRVPPTPQDEGASLNGEPLYDFYPYTSHGVEVFSAWNVQLMDNTIHHARGYGASLRSCAQVGIGGGNSISSYGAQVGATAQHPGLVENITGSTYATAPTTWKWVNAWGQTMN